MFNSVFYYYTIYVNKLNSFYSVLLATYLVYINKWNAFIYLDQFVYLNK